MHPPVHIRLLNGLSRLLSGIGSALAWLVRPFEFALGWLFGRALAATEAVDYLDVLVYWILRILLAPFRLVFWAIDRIIPDAVRQWFIDLGDLIAAGWFACIGALLRLVEWLNLDIVFHWIALITWPIWRPIAGILGFIYAWIVTRETQQVARGLPAVLLMAPLVFLGIRTYTQGSQASIAKYRIALEEANEVRDHSAVQIYQRKLEQLGVDTQLQTYNRGLALAEQGEMQEAYEVFQQLAPEEEVGYPPARLWIVGRLLDGELEEDEESRDQAMEIQLAALEADAIRHPLIDISRSQLLIKRGELVTAVERLRPLANNLPFAAMQVMRLDLKLGNNSELLVDAQRVIDYIDRKRDKEPLLTSDYAFWIMALEISGRIDEVESVYEQWLELDPENEAAQLGWARTVRRAVERMVLDPNANPTEIANLLILTTQIAADQAWLRDQFDKLYDLRDNSIIKTSVPKQTMEVILKQNCPQEILQALGEKAALEEEWSRALQCFASLAETQPGNASAWNNLAWVQLQDERATLEIAKEEGRTAVVDEEELNNALTACNRALELEPNDCRFRETRGQIHLELEQWQKAVTDLEYAANGMPENAKIHEALAKAYRATGKDELAAIHEQAASDE